MSENQPEKYPAGRDDYFVEILQERAVKAFELPHRSAPMRAHTALVLLTAKGRHKVVHLPERPTAGELFWMRIRRVYEVDLGQHFNSVGEAIPSRGDALPFHATVDLQWRVKKPYEVVRHRINTSRALIDAIRPELLSRMRKVSRLFEVDQSERAESAINTELKDPLGVDLGLWIRPYVRLFLEQSTIDHARKVLDLRRRIEIEEKYADELRQITGANRQKSLRSRLDFYREIISTGDVEQFAMRIAHDESDLSAAIAAFHNARATDHRNLIEFVTQLTESGVVERHEMSDRVREALDWLNKSVTRVIGTDESLTSTGYSQHRPPGSTTMPPAHEAPPSDQAASHDNTDGRQREGEPSTGAG